MIPDARLYMIVAGIPRKIINIYVYDSSIIFSGVLSPRRIDIQRMQTTTVSISEIAPAVQMLFATNFLIDE